MENTQSISKLIEDIEKGRIALPEFQRDFVWDLGKTYDLFDSLLKDIFIGPIIYGLPSFEIAYRQIDDRDRVSKGKRRHKIETQTISKKELDDLHKINKDSFRLILDGQQRATSIYRAVKGIDVVWFLSKNEDEINNDLSFEECSLEDLLYCFADAPDSERICIALHHVWEIDKNDFDEEDVKKNFFEKTPFYRYNYEYFTENEEKKYFKRYRSLKKKLMEFFHGEKLISYYLLDMSLEKFVTFFERSNTKGVNLNFIDILSAKLYTGDFNLKKKISQFETDNSRIKLTPEIIVRTLAYVKSMQKSVNEKYILESLNAEDFHKMWDEICNLYKKSVVFLIENHYIISQSWMPYENMLIPLMVFLKEIKGDFHSMTQEQKKFISWWYWNAIFSKRYSGSSNEKIIEDSIQLTFIAGEKKIKSPTFFNKLTKLHISSPEDIHSVSRKSDVLYQGVFNLVHFSSGGLLNWENTAVLSGVSDLEDHHIFPKNYLKKHLGIDTDDEMFDVDCVINRTLMPKRLNLKVSDKKPSEYLNEIKINNNEISKVLAVHLIPVDILDGIYDGNFGFFMQYRGEEIFNCIEVTVIKPKEEIKKLFLEEINPDGQAEIVVFGEYKKKKVEARFNRLSENIFFNNNLYKTPSAAATAAKEYCGADADNTENGWRWWKFESESGTFEPIMNLRNKKS